MSIVYDFEDIARRMNRKPEVAAKVEVIESKVIDENKGLRRIKVKVKDGGAGGGSSLLGDIKPSRSLRELLEAAHRTNNVALLRRLYEAGKTTPPQSEDREAFLRTWNAHVDLSRQQNVFAGNYRFIGVDWAK